MSHYSNKVSLKPCQRDQAAEKLKANEASVWKMSQLSEEVLESKASLAMTSNLLAVKLPEGV